MQASTVDHMAVIFHALNNEKNNNNSQVCVTTHPVQDNAGRLVIGAGQNLSKQDQSRMAAILIDSLDTDLKMFPDTVLARSFDSLVWYRKAKVSEMRFLVNGSVVSFDAPSPNLIFKLSKGKLYVVAVEGQKKPSFKSKLYHAPYANIFEGTNMCVGNNPLPQYPSFNSIDFVERMFFGSEFTEHKHDLCIKGAISMDDHLAFWKGLEGKKSFPNRSMNYLKERFGESVLSLREWIEQ